jgi:beta-lactamase regulating signal transducer with metallopeptidase domain
MNPALAAVLANRDLIFLGWVLLVVLWETTIVTVLFAAWRVRRGRPRSQADYHAAITALAAAFVLALIVPIVLAAWPDRAMATAAIDAPAGGMAPADARKPPAAGHDAHVGGALGDTGLPVQADAIAAAAAVIWIAGVAGLALRLAGGWLVTRRLLRRATPLAQSELAALATAAAASAGVRGGVDVVESRDVEAPMVLRWRRPVLVVPRAALLRLDAEQTSALFVHEFAHVRRRDYLVNLVQSVLELLLFFSPAVIWLSRRIREAREFCCDDVAVEQCGNRATYIQALTTLAALATANAARAAQGISGPRLITRVRRLLEEDPMPRFRPLRITALAAVLLALVVTGFQVSAMSAARVPGRSPAVQGPVPYGYVPSQEGAGVEIVAPHRNDANVFDTVTLRNKSNQTLTAVRFVAAVESRTLAGMQPVRLLMSRDIPLALPPGTSVEVAADVPTAEQFEAVARELAGARLQLFLGLQSATFANGFRWEITPNASARSGSEALGILRPVYPRALIDRDAPKTPSPDKPCDDDRGRATSHGGVIPILDEPGHFMRCTDGRWVEASVSR